MSTADGDIIGAKQIFGKAPTSHAFNIVLLGDGFKQDTEDDRQQEHFDIAAQGFLRQLLGTKPFDRLSAGINVFKVNVWSMDEGADDPSNGIACRTYFDSSFAGSGMQRRLVCNSAAALRVATSYVPEVHLTVVVVNSMQHGGSGSGGVATVSLPAGAMHVALHEAGHAAFNLADEYDHVPTDPGPTQHPADEPMKVNLTTMVSAGAGKTTNEQRLKWRWALTPGVPLPTTAPAPGCLPNTAPNPHPPGTVGAFTGGGRYNCGVYRPEFDCKMRNYWVPFCRVCQQQISDVINSRSTLRPRARTPITVVARDAEHLDVFAVAADGRTMNDWWDPQHGWSGWSQIAGGRAGSGSPVNAITRYGTQLGAFTVGTDSQVIGTYWNPLSGWLPWAALPDLTCRRGSAVTAHLRGSDHIDLFAVRQDGQVMSTWTEGGKAWVPWFPVTNGEVSLGSPVTAVSRSTAQVDLFTVGPDSRVWSTVWQPIVGWWKWFWVGDLVCRPGSTVTCVARNANHVDLFATAQDSAVMTAHYTPLSGWSTWSSVSGGVASPGSPVSALSRRTDQMDVFVLGTDERVYTAQWHESGGWSGWDVVQNGQGLRGGTVSAVSRAPDTVDLVVVGTDWTPWTTSRRDGSNWDMWTRLSVT